MAFTIPRTWTDGELVTKAIMDPHVRDNFLAMGPHLIARKSADEAVTSSTTLQDDDDLFAPVLANEVWRLEWVLLITGSTSADFKLAFTFPGGVFACNFTDVLSDGSYRFFNFNAAASPTGTLDVGITQATPTVRLMNIPAVYSNGGAAGDVKLQWAQQTSSGTPTTFKINSTLWGVKLA